MEDKYRQKMFAYRVRLFPLRIYVLQLARELNKFSDKLVEEKNKIEDEGDGDTRAVDFYIVRTMEAIDKLTEAHALLDSAYVELDKELDQEGK